MHITNVLRALNLSWLALLEHASKTFSSRLKPDYLYIFQYLQILYSVFSSALSLAY